MEAKIKPIAYIHNDFKEKFGVPRQSGRVQTISEIVFEPEFRDENALIDIEQFSHLWLIFDFSLSHKDTWSPTVRPPRLGGNKRVGVFASRSPFRPNNLGLSVVKLLSLDKTADKGVVLNVSGADLVDNTPIYDIKPYIPYADCILDAKGGYAEQNKGHKLKVVFPDELRCKIPDEKSDILIECLADDPRPSYQDDGRVYTMRFSNFDISFSVTGDTLLVTAVKEISEV